MASKTLQKSLNRLRGHDIAILLRAMAWGMALMLLSCWGLLAYILYQKLAFDTPLAFVETQGNWYLHPSVPSYRKDLDLLTLEPIRSVYNPESPCYWRIYSSGSAVFSIPFANPLCFVLAVVLIGLGAWKHWLNILEVSLAVPLLLIPYLTRAHEMCMHSQGRFVATIFPVYLVLACLLSRVPKAVIASLAAASGVLLGIYAALFATWHSAM